MPIWSKVHTSKVPFFWSAHCLFSRLGETLDHWSHNKCRSQWPTFHRPVICFISWRLFDGWMSYFRIMRYNGITLDLNLIMGHNVIYFMFQWYCLITWRLFEWWVSFCGIMSQSDKTFDLRVNVGHSDLYFMVQWFSLYLKNYLKYEHHTLG